MLDIAVWAVPFGIVGGRLYHVISSPRAYFGENGDPLRAFAIWEGGLGIWGAIALGGVGAWIACRRRGIPLPAFADALAPGLLVAQAIGRLGNWFNNELYGGPTDLPWGLRIYEWDGGAGGRRRRRAADRARHLPPDVPLRAAVEPGGGRLRDLGRPSVPARATGGPSRSTWPATASAGSGSSCCAPTRPRHFFGVRLNVFTSIVVGLLAVAYFIWQRGQPREVIERGPATSRPGPRGGVPGGRGSPP